MKQFFSFVTKEFYHIFRDRRTMLILLGMPIVQIILFGFAITTEVKNVRVAVYDPSKDIVTKRISERINANEYMNVSLYLSTDKDIENVFKSNKADLIIVFGDRFSERLRHSKDASVQLITDSTDPNTATTLTGYATQIIQNVIQDELKITPAPNTIIPQVKLLYNPGMKAAYNFVPGVMGLILMLICAMMTSISIVREKESGTMEILLVSPIKPILIVIAKAVPYFVLSCVNLGTILLLSRFVLHVPVAGSLTLLIVVSMLFILVALSLGLLISTLTKTQTAAMLASGMVLMMPVMLLSGIIFPTESMPVILREMSNIIPAKWYIIAIKKIMIEGLNIHYVLKEIAILIGMASILLTISIKKFNVRL